MPHVPEKITSEGPDGRQDVHNSGVDTQLADAHLPAEDHGAQIAGHSELARERNSFLEETFSVASRDQRDQRTGLP